jgi:hypothetical protein
MVDRPMAKSGVNVRKETLTQSICFFIKFPLDSLWTKGNELNVKELSKMPSAESPLKPMMFRSFRRGI